MLVASIPVKYTVVWGASAGGSYIRTVPVPSQIGIQNGAASFTDGFPPLTMTIGSNVFPFGQDFNGILKVTTAWDQWYQAGGPVLYDSTFQVAVFGYPLGAKVGSANVVGRNWTSTTDGNTTNPDASGAGWLASQDIVVPGTGAQLQYTSATILTLVPRNGGLLWINGFNYPVPASLTITNSGLAASTLYYAYALITGGNMVLALSTTGYAVASNGMPQKSGDATQTLVGMAYTNSSSQFVSADGSLQVRTYFQRPNIIRSRTNFTADKTLSTGTLTEVDASIRNSFLVWAGENVQFSMTGNTQAASNDVVSAVSFDGGSPELESCAASGVSGIPINGVKTGLSEGLHYATLFGAISTGSPTATWRGGSAPSGTGGTAPTAITLAFH